MNTTDWGPHLWKYLGCVAVNYPVHINWNKVEDVRLAKRYKQFFVNQKYILPCKYCRISYTKFLKELPIDPYLDGRNKLTYWLYLMHDKVNQKLIHQERKALKEKMTDAGIKPGSKQAKQLRKKMLYTKRSPKYEVFCRQFEKYRANCSKEKTRGEIPSCRVPAMKL